MQWEAISAIGQMIGAVAVVISLIYLALQVRTTVRLNRAVLLQGLHGVGAQLQAAMLSDTALLRCFKKGCQDFSLLDDDDADRFNILLSKLFNNYELYFMLAREVRFPNDVIEAQQRIMQNRLRLPGVLSWWQQHHDTFSMDFVAWVNSLTAKS